MRRLGLLALAALLLILTACDNGNGGLTMPAASITAVEPTTLEAGTHVTVAGTGFYETSISGQMQIDVCGVTVNAELVTPITQTVVLPPGGPVSVEVGTELEFTMPDDGLTAGADQPLSLTRPDGSGTTFAGITCVVAPEEPAPEPTQVTAVINASATSGVAPAVISFDAEGSTGEGELAFVWEFGPEGATGEGFETSFEYDEVGSFTVRLTVRDETGAEATAEQEIVIHPELQAVLGLTDGLLRAPATVAFDASASTGIGPLTYNWTFGVEDAGSTQAEAEFTYQVPGEYEVSLTVTDAHGESASASHTLVVHPAVEAVIAHSDVDGRAPVTVLFDGTGSQGIEPLTFAWSFGVDEAASTEAEPEFTYDEPGVYEVVLTVTDAEGGEATVTESLAIDSPVLAVIDYADSDYRAPATVQFDGSASTGVAPISYSWNIGDDEPFGDGATSEFTFDEAGTFDVKLTVEDADGHVSEVTRTITINPPVTARINRSSPEENTAPVTIEFDATGSTGVAPLNYSWEFLPAGTTGSGERIEVTYDMPGEYEVQLLVTDALGATASTTLGVTVVAEPVTADIVASATSVYLGTEVTFSAANSSGREPLLYNWRFSDDASAAVGVEVSHVFNTVGQHIVDLDVEDGNGNFARASVIIEVASEPVYQTSIIVELPNGADAGNFTGVDLTITDTGDYSTFQVTDLAAAPALPAGVYSLEINNLEREGVQDGSYSDYMRSGTVEFVIAEGATEPVQVFISYAPVNGAVNAAADGLPDGYSVIDVMEVSSQGGIPSPVDTATLSLAPGVYEFDFLPLAVDPWLGQYEPNEYYKRVSVSSGESQELSVQYDYSPVAEFTIAGRVETGNTITFTADELGGGPGTPQYSWSLGDGSQATGAVVEHQFAGPGVYEITLVVTNDSGTLTDSATFTLLIHEPVTEGGLAANLTGLPEGTTVDGTLTHPDGESETIAWNTEYSLAPGDYSLVVPYYAYEEFEIPLAYSGGTTTASVRYTLGSAEATTEFTVVAGETVSLDIDYELDEFEGNWLELIVGYDDGGSGAVDVRVFSPQEKQVWSLSQPGQDMRGDLPLGEYRIVAYETADGWPSGISEQYVVMDSSVAQKSLEVTYERSDPPQEQDGYVELSTSGLPAVAMPQGSLRSLSSGFELDVQLNETVRLEPGTYVLTPDDQYDDVTPDELPLHDGGFADSHEIYDLAWPEGETTFTVTSGATSSLTVPYERRGDTTLALDIRPWDLEDWVPVDVSVYYPDGNLAAAYYHTGTFLVANGDLPLGEYRIEILSTEGAVYSGDPTQYVLVDETGGYEWVAIDYELVSPGPGPGDDDGGIEISVPDATEAGTMDLIYRQGTESIDFEVNATGTGVVLEKVTVSLSDYFGGASQTLLTTEPGDATFSGSVEIEPCNYEMSWSGQLTIEAWGSGHITASRTIDLTFQVIPDYSNCDG